MVQDIDVILEEVETLPQHLYLKEMMEEILADHLVGIREEAAVMQLQALMVVEIAADAAEMELRQL